MAGAQYVGRFAPSPTGPLHLGSLLSAVASWLDARQRQGRWHLRIDDIDPPREVPGAADTIQRDLEHLGLHWDGPVLFQSARIPDYAAAAEQLLASGQAYRCRCSRRDLRAAMPDPGDQQYPGTCRRAAIPADEESAVRLLVESEQIDFGDRLQGPQCHIPADVWGDFVIYRRDRLPAYHLATVLDEAYLGITDVVRGIDLLPATPSHIYLQKLLGLPPPRYAHVPIVVNSRGQKLSKQTGAGRPTTQNPALLVWRLLAMLDLSPPPEARDAPTDDLWAWAIPRWRIERLAGKRSLNA